MTVIKDTGIVLRVESRTAEDKFVTCLFKEHGKRRFVAYGARYQRSSAGKILQPLACVEVELDAGHTWDRLRSSELAELPYAYDYKQLAYAMVLAELTDVLTADAQPDSASFHLFRGALQLLRQRNPRLVVLAYAIQLLDMTGFMPQLDGCVGCGSVLPAEDCFFSAAQGGVVCQNCHKEGERVLPFSGGARQLYGELRSLDFDAPSGFSVRGGDLMQVERAVLSFLLYQTDRPLKSVSYLRQLGL